MDRVHGGDHHPVPGLEGDGDHRKLPRRGRTTPSISGRRRFESEEHRKELYAAVYESDFWRDEVAPNVVDLIDRDLIQVTRVVPTPRSVAQ